MDVADTDLQLVEIVGGIADLEGQGLAGFLLNGGRGGGALEEADLLQQANVGIGEVGVAGVGGALGQDQALTDMDKTTKS